MKCRRPLSRYLDPIVNDINYSYSIMRDRFSRKSYDAAYPCATCMSINNENAFWMSIDFEYLGDGLAYCVPTLMEI